MMTPVVLTGASGFIGGNLLARLCARGREVRCLVRAQELRDWKRADGAQIHVVDYLAPETLARCPALKGELILYHLAGATKGGAWRHFHEANVLPTRHLIRALKRNGARCRRLVLVSSLAAAGPSVSASSPRREEDTPHPVEHYGKSKLRAEEELRRSPFPWTIIRPAAVYGPGDRDFLPLYQQLGRGILLETQRAGSLLNLLYVQDLVEALLRIPGARAAEGGVYFLGSDPPVRWRDLAHLIAAAQGVRRLRLQFRVPAGLLAIAGRCGDLYIRATGAGTLINSQKVRLGSERAWTCSCDRARKDFGFDPQTSLEQGIAQTVRWYQEKGWL